MCTLFQNSTLGLRGQCIVKEDYELIIFEIMVIIFLVFCICLTFSGLKGVGEKSQAHKYM